MANQRAYPNLSGLGLPLALTHAIRQMCDWIFQLQTSASTSGSSSPLAVVHSQRRVYAPSSYPPNTLLIETDRNLLYINRTFQGTLQWTYLSGVYCDVLANRPTDLQTFDRNLLFNSTDTHANSRWDGSTWTTFP